MEYKPRPGIVKLKICGMNVLAPSREASGVCKTILPLTMRELAVWSGIENDYPYERVYDLCRVFSKLPDEELKNRIDAICENFIEKGFIVPKDHPEARSDI